MRTLQHLIFKEKPKGYTHTVMAIFQHNSGNAVGHVHLNDF